MSDMCLFAATQEDPQMISRVMRTIAISLLMVSLALAAAAEKGVPKKVSGLFSWIATEGK